MRAGGTHPRVLLVDHRDSFVHILGAQFRAAGAEVKTLRSSVSLATLRSALQELEPQLVVLSPGPGAPEASGVSLEWLRSDPHEPILGICLGLQAMVLAAGGVVSRAPAPVHGRADEVRVDGDPDRVDNPLAAAFLAAHPPHSSFRAARYHSLCATRLPAELQTLAHCEHHDSRVPMVLAATDRPRLGLQFHPESILSPSGGPLLRTLLATTQDLHTPRPS